MITAGDILRLDYTPDLTQGGISYACHSLAYAYSKVSRAAPNRLRHAVARVAVELAFRRHLIAEGIPFNVKGALPFTDPGQFNVMLDGRRCDIQTSLIADQRQCRSIHLDPGMMLTAAALVPVDQFAAEGQSPHDLYLFAFLLGGNADLPGHLVYVMPASWAYPRVWVPLRPLALKSEEPGALELEIGGQDGGRESLMRSVVLPPQTRLELEDNFYSLTYLHAATRPRGRLGVHSPSRRETQVIDAAEWRDIWLNGTDIYLAGWITREQFRRQARLVREGSRVFQSRHTQTKNLAVPISDLKPLRMLFERMRS